MSSTPRFHGYPLSHFAHAAAVSEQGRKAENVANRATSNRDFRRSGEFLAGSAYSWAPPAPSPRGWTSPKIKTLKYDMYHGKDPALGGGAVAASRRRRRFGGVGPPGEAKDSISPLKPAHGSDRSNPQTPCKTPAKSTFSPATPELERRPQSEQRPRKTPTKETLTPRPPTAPAPTKVVIKGPLTSFEEVVRAAKADAAGLLVEAPPPRTVSCPNPSVCVHTGNIMPSCWSPVLEPRPEDVDPARTFEHAGKVTGIRRPNTARPTYHREKPRKVPEDLNDVRSQMMYTGSAAFVPARRNYLPPNEDEMKAKRRENRQQLLGKHIIHRTLEKNKTLVHYSYLYYQAKKITKDATTSKGIGTVVDWDPDGLMTHVRWQDGSVEYCCTGFSGFYFLALLEVTEDKKKKETEKEEIVSNVNFEDLSHYPAFWINEQGISRMAAKPGTHHRTPRDIAQTRGWITRLNKLLADAQGNRKALLTKQLERAEADLTSLLHDRRIMTAGMVCKIGDKETVLRPSTLAPAGFVPKAKKVTILEEVKRLVRREAEKERRRRREEEELKRERRRLERKMLKKSRDVEHLEIAHKVRLERKMMDPWTAIITANEQQLGHILHQTFTLFDLDLSGWIDVHEFEQAMDQMGLHGQSEILEALLLATDVDRSGHIDFREFQHLALSLIEARKHVKEQERHRNEKVRKAKRREAAGFSSISESDMTEDEAEEEQTMLEKAVAASSLLMKDVEGVDAPPQRKRRMSVSSVHSNNSGPHDVLSRTSSTHSTAGPTASSGFGRTTSGVKTAPARRNSAENASIKPGGKPAPARGRRYSLTFGELPANLPYDSFAPAAKPAEKHEEDDDEDGEAAPEKAPAEPETTQRRTLRTLGESERELSGAKASQLASSAAHRAAPPAKSTQASTASLVSMTPTPRHRAPPAAQHTSPLNKTQSTTPRHDLQPTPPSAQSTRPKSARQRPSPARTVSWS